MAFLNQVMEFQSPCGDSLFSDRSDTIVNMWVGIVTKSFNPLAGIRCFLTRLGRAGTDYTDGRVRFNPLAGIRCFLTRASRHEQNH